MTEQDDTFRQATLLPDEPTHQEMAEAEAQLAELPPAAPLSDAEIAALMARAVAPARPRRWTGAGRRLLLACGIALLSLGSVAWFTLDLWPNRRHAALELGYPEAVMMTTQFSYSDSERLSAFGQILERCDFAAKLLTDLRGGTSAAIAIEANNVRARLSYLLANGTQRGPGPVSDDMQSICEIARNENLPLPDRQAALAQVEQLTEEGLRAVLHARMVSQEGENSRNVLRGLLAEILAR
jgi:hypothetical protein